jgi:hypothetical protein
MQTSHTAGPWRVFDAFTDIEIVTDARPRTRRKALFSSKGSATRRRMLD